MLWLTGASRWLLRHLHRAWHDHRSQQRCGAIPAIAAPSGESCPVVLAWPVCRSLTAALQFVAIPRDADIANRVWEAFGVDVPAIEAWLQQLIAEREAETKRDDAAAQPLDFTAGAAQAANVVLTQAPRVCTREQALRLLGQPVSDELTRGIHAVDRQTRMKMHTVAAATIMEQQLRLPDSVLRQCAQVRAPCVAVALAWCGWVWKPV